MRATCMCNQAITYLDFGPYSKSPRWVHDGEPGEAHGPTGKFLPVAVASGIREVVAS